LELQGRARPAPTLIMTVTAAPRLLRRDSQIPDEVKFFTDS
jgi:hypothetical protein